MKPRQIAFAAGVVGVAAVVGFFGYGYHHHKGAILKHPKAYVQSFTLPDPIYLSAYDKWQTDSDYAVMLAAMRERAVALESGSAQRLYEVDRSTASIYDHSPDELEIILLHKGVFDEEAAHFRVQRVYGSDSDNPRGEHPNQLALERSKGS